MSVISWPDVAEWRRVTGADLLGWELQAIRALDRERVHWLNKPESERKQMMPATPESMAAAFRAVAGNKRNKPKTRERSHGR